MYLQKFDLMFIAECLNQPDVTSFGAILCQKTQESLAPACGL